VDYGQGWYFSKGMTAVEFMNFARLFNNGSA
jgi:sensor c-di-GMP phosphodiesterase-like protein